MARLRKRHPAMTFFSDAPDASHSIMRNVFFLFRRTMYVCACRRWCRCHREALVLSNSSKLPQTVSASGMPVPHATGAHACVCRKTPLDPLHFRWNAWATHSTVFSQQQRLEIVLQATICARVRSSHHTFSYFFHIYSAVSHFCFAGHVTSRQQQQCLPVVTARRGTSKTRFNIQPDQETSFCGPLPSPQEK
jgi:hypothetical protein